MAILCEERSIRNGFGLLSHWRPSRHQNFSELDLVELQYPHLLFITSLELSLAIVDGR